MTISEDLIVKSSPGDPKVYESLMVEYFNFVNRLCVSILGDDCDADDAVQETFINAVTHLSDYQPGTNLRSWLARIAVNQCRDRLRRQHTRQRLLDLLKPGAWHAGQAAHTPEETVIRGERQKELRAGVQSLPEKQRVPVLLRYVHGMSISEISQVLQISEGTVHSRLHYALLKLRARLFLPNSAGSTGATEGDQ